MFAIPRALLRRADAILMCSKREAFGRVTVEGMLAGKPVIGANSGGTLELIQDGITGLLYTSGDPKALAEKIRYLYENPDTATHVGENAKAWAETSFTRDRYRKDVLEAFGSLFVAHRIEPLEVVNNYPHS